MPAIKLTDGAVVRAEPSSQDAYIWDSELPRFGLRITPAGSKIYMVQYRAKAAPGEPSKIRKISIGKHDGDLWNATKARAAARNSRGCVCAAKGQGRMLERSVQVGTAASE